MTRANPILVVDDEPVLLDNISLALEAEHYEVFTAPDGSEALAVMQMRPIDLILADISMPDMNGYQLYERIREKPEWMTVPFIFLSARTMDSDISYGKEMGVDDYLTKPVRARELLAVVRGKLRRAQQLNQLRPTNDTKTTHVNVGRLRIEPEQHRVWLNKKELRLSAKEFTLLDCLAQKSGKVVSPQILVQATHGFETDHIEAGALVRPIVLSLRRKLSLPLGEVGSVENVRSVGYRLVTSDD